MIELRHIRKKFENHLALHDLDLTIESGSLFGYIGPNGAGKSTTIKILATLEYPDRGSVRINGIDALENPEAVRRIIGYMPELFGLYDNLPTHEYLEFFAGVYRVSTKVVDEVIELTGLGPKRDANCGTLSKGNRQRLYIARLLLHDPSVLLLDEPASGLDPLARIELRELLRELHKMGKTILVSSHILSDLEEICDTIGIIERGKMVASGSLAELRARMRSDFEITVRFVDTAPENVLPQLEQDERLSTFKIEGDRLCFRFRGDRQAVAEFLRQLSASHPFWSFEASEGSLESLFMRLTQGTVS